MENKLKPQLVRVVDFVAESLEAEAAKMPPSYKETADLLRNAAAEYRKLSNPKLVRVWQEQPTATSYDRVPHPEKCPTCETQLIPHYNGEELVAVECPNTNCMFYHQF